MSGKKDKKAGLVVAAAAAPEVFTRLSGLWDLQCFLQLYVGDGSGGGGGGGYVPRG